MGHLCTPLGRSPNSPKEHASVAGSPIWLASHYFPTSSPNDYGLQNISIFLKKNQYLSTKVWNQHVYIKVNLTFSGKSFTNICSKKMLDPTFLHDDSQHFSTLFSSSSPMDHQRRQPAVQPRSAHDAARARCLQRTRRT
jgi:hypothetical protein